MKASLLRMLAVTALLVCPVQMAGAENASQTSRTPIEIEKYNFGRLMEALYEGGVGSIPDDQKTRSIVGSILRGIGEICQLTPVDVVGKSMTYISPDMRVMSRNPAKGIADILNDLGHARDSPDMIGGMTEMMEKRAAFAVEGLRDGRVFVANHRCVSLEYEQVTKSLYQIVRERGSREPDAYDEIEFTRLMTPSFRERNGYTDPTEALRERKREQAVASAERACKSVFPDGTFCGCSVERMVQSDLDEVEWASIGADFKSITRVPRMRSVIAACY